MYLLYTGNKTNPWIQRECLTAIFSLMIAGSVFLSVLKRMQHHNYAPIGIGLSIRGLRGQDIVIILHCWPPNSLMEQKADCSSHFLHSQRHTPSGTVL
jgi:hypothetical protein